MSTTTLTTSPDIMAIRASVSLVLAPDIPRANPGDPESGDAPELRFNSLELDSLARTYREHIEALTPAVQAWAEQLPDNHPNRVSALMCVGQAQHHLRLGLGDTDAIRGSIASRLARSVRTLCGHYDRLVPR